jgi:UDP-N-acetylmuramate--alanine ligase
MSSITEAQRIHIIGIGGAGMSPLARILLQQGRQVSGSDLRLSAVTAALAAQGATIMEGHHPEHVHGADLVVTTSAARPDNPEIREAHRLGIPVIKGAVLLGAFMDGRRGIAVAGTHGKTTTTAMIAVILTRAGYEPTFVVGGEVQDLGTSGQLGRGDWMVAEADEYDERFLHLHPEIAVITNVEADHLDYYGTVDALQAAFARFANGVRPGGWLVTCLDDPVAGKMSLHRHGVLTYGLNPAADWRVSHLRLNDRGGYDGCVWDRERDVADLSLGIPGRHNIQNALAAIAVTSLIGVPPVEAAAILHDFQGVRRRFERRGEVGGITIIDDYGHHPTEIRATLRAARERYPTRRILAVHQPHTYSRTKNLLHEFSACFTDADLIIITDIYPARETDSLGVHATDLVAIMQHDHVRYVPTLTEAAHALVEEARPGDVIITIGAGDVWRVGDEVQALLSERGGHG